MKSALPDHQNLDPKLQAAELETTKEESARPDPPFPVHGFSPIAFRFRKSEFSSGFSGFDVR